MQYTFSAFWVNWRAAAAVAAAMLLHNAHFSVSDG